MLPFGNVPGSADTQEGSELLTLTVGHLSAEAAAHAASPRHSGRASELLGHLVPSQSVFTTWQQRVTAYKCRTSRASQSFLELPGASQRFPEPPRAFWSLWELPSGAETSVFPQTLFSLEFRLLYQTAPALREQHLHEHLHLFTAVVEGSAPWWP